MRFPGFAEEWKERKLGEIATFSKGKGVSKSDISEDGNLECIRYGELYTFYGEVIDSIQSKTNLNSEDLVLSEINDIIIPSSGESSIDIATASCVTKSGVALGGDLNIIKTSHNGIFLSYYLNSKKKLDIARLSQGVSVVHLYSSQLATLSLNLPSIQEQNQVAMVLSEISSRIELSMKTIESLESLIKGVSQKLFTQKLRFKEFTDEWKVKTLGKVLNEPKQVPVEKPNEVELLTVKLHCKGIENTGNYPAVTKNGRPYYRRFKNEILIGRQNFHNGGIGIVKDENDGKICSNAISSYNVLTDNLLFVYFYISRPQYYTRVDDLIGGTGQKEISKSEFLKLKINIPCIEEQTKIANFLSKISDKIETEKKILELLEQQKKYFLQNMFI